MEDIDILLKKIVEEEFKIIGERRLLCEKYRMEDDILNRINILEEIIKKEIEELKLKLKRVEIKRLNELDEEYEYEFDLVAKGYNKAINKLEEVLKSDKNDLNKYENELVFKTSAYSIPYFWSKKKKE